MATATTPSTPLRSASLVLSLLLALVLQPLAAVPAAAAPVPPLPDDPAASAEVAAGWLALQLVDGERLEGEFGPDVGLTADAVIALAAAGVAEEQLQAATDWLSTQVAAYTQGVPADQDDAVYAGATAKLILALLVGDRDVRDVGGTDLIAQLEDREQADGRFTDTSEFGEFSSTLTQALAVLALERSTDTEPSAAAVQLLLDQQCEDGGFRFDLAAEDCTSAVDTTGFVVQALTAVGGDAPTAAATTAAQWLVSIQADDGVFASADGPNANSTALAAVALELVPTVTGRDEALDAARSALLSLRTGCEGPYPGAIPFSGEVAGDVARATTQAIPGLVGATLATVSAAGASAQLPALLPFTDVTAGSAHAPAICELTARGAVQGFDARTFGPGHSVTRGQAAAVLAELLGLAPLDGAPFTDVTEGSRYAGAIAALENAELVSGRSDGSFGPDEPLQRDQAASLLAGALGLEDVGGQPFADVTDGNVHAGSIAALEALDIITGTSSTTFSPADELRRDQFASLLQRSFPAEEGDAA